MLILLEYLYIWHTTPQVQIHGTGGVRIETADGRLVTQSGEKKQTKHAVIATKVKTEGEMRQRNDIRNRTNGGAKFLPVDDWLASYYH